MTDKEQIEEMARSCCGRSRTYKTCEECIKESEKVFGKTDIGDCECYSYARRFFNKSYRKVSEDEIVISKKEYNRIPFSIIDIFLKAVYDTEKELLSQLNKEKD